MMEKISQLILSLQGILILKIRRSFSPLTIFRFSFFLGIAIHFFPSFFYFNENYSSEAFRTAFWNRWIFENFLIFPPLLSYSIATATILTCLSAMTGFQTRLSSLICMLGLYFFCSVNSLHTHTLALSTLFSIFPLWILFGKSEKNHLAFGIGTIILTTVFFAGIEKLLVGWPLKNEMQVLFTYPIGILTRDWVIQTPQMHSYIFTKFLDIITVLIEVFVPLLLIFKRIRTPLILLYECFFLGVVCCFEVPLLFYFIFAPGILVLFEDIEFSRTWTFTAKKGLYYFWLSLWLFGALNQSILNKLFNFHVNLPLHLKHGSIMFTESLASPETFTFSENASSPHLNIAHLFQTPSFGYKRSRATTNILFFPDYLDFLCAQVIRKSQFNYLFYVEKFNRLNSVDHTTQTFGCTPDGLILHQ